MCVIRFCNDKFKDEKDRIDLDLFLFFSLSLKWVLNIMDAEMVSV